MCYFVSLITLETMVVFFYSIRSILNRLSDYVGTIAAKRYRLYLKEGERKKRYSEWTQYVIAAILWLVRLITNTLEKFNIESKRVIEKVLIE